MFERFCLAGGLGPDDVHAVATSAIRDASNRDEFLARAAERTHLKIEVLSEQDEARFGYVAAVNTSTLTDGAVLELGGGSMQLIEVADRQAKALCSFEVGAVRLTERFLRGSGPAKKKELQQVRSYVRKTLSAADWLAAQAIAWSGSVARCATWPPRPSAEPTRSTSGSKGSCSSARCSATWCERLASLPVAERGEVPGIKPGRGDIILAAALVIETVLDTGGFEGIEVTEAGLREGVFLARELLAGGEPLFDNVREAAVSNLAVQYESDMNHVRHVARLSLQMFDSLVDAGLIVPLPSERELLWAASMLHDVGMTIAYDDHHKHSQYLIISAELPGFDPA